MGAKIMTTSNIHAKQQLGFQDRGESKIINVSDIHPSVRDLAGLQTHKYDGPLTSVHKEVLELSLEADFYFFSIDTVQHELDEIRKEVDETCAVAEDVYCVPESAYNETLSLLTRVHHNIPIPDIMWLEDGGIGLEWRPGDGIVTMSLYGDNHVTFVAILGNQHEIAGTCPLSDSRILPSFLATLPLLFRQRM